MDDITFNISLQEGTTEGQFMRYEPGSPISGIVQVIPNVDVNARNTTVRLRWKTDGRGDINSQNLAEVEISKGPLAKGRPIQKEFYFQLPMEPWSYSGHYINIVWEIIVSVDVPFAVDKNKAQRFIVRPAQPN